MVAPLDLSGVDLSKPSGQSLRPDKRWTVTLIFKLAAPLALALVRDTLCCQPVTRELELRSKHAKMSCTGG